MFPAKDMAENTSVSMADLPQTHHDKPMHAPLDCAAVGSINMHSVLCRQHNQELADLRPLNEAAAHASATTAASAASSAASAAVGQRALNEATAIASPVHFAPQVRLAATAVDMFARNVFNYRVTPTLLRPCPKPHVPHYRQLRNCGSLTSPVCCSSATAPDTHKCALCCRCRRRTFSAYQCTSPTPPRLRSAWRPTAVPSAIAAESSSTVRSVTRSTVHPRQHPRAATRFSRRGMPLNFSKGSKALQLPPPKQSQLQPAFSAGCHLQEQQAQVRAECID